MSESEHSNQDREQNNAEAGLKGELRAIARGRASRTPFVVFFVVNLIFLVLAALLSLLVLVVLWLL